MNADSSRPPQPLVALLFALVMLALALIGTFTGKARYWFVTDRAKEPFKYWLTIVVQYLGAAFMIWVWLNTRQ